MATILHKYGKKANYLALDSYDSNSLYFCTDSKEVFKGEDLYTDGVRLVSDYSSLPDLSVAADGKLYICEDTGNGYVLNEARDDWTNVVHGVDGETLSITTEGLMTVASVPIASVVGLTERLQSIEAIVISGGSETVDGTVDTYDDLPTDVEVGTVYEVTEDGSTWYYDGTTWIEYNPSETTTTLTPIATSVINSSQFKIDDNNILNIINVDSSLVSYNDTTVEQTLNSLVEALSWESIDSTTYSVTLETDSVSEVLASAEDGDVVELDTGSVTEELTITTTVTVKGTNAGVSQNFA